MTGAEETGRGQRTGGRRQLQDVASVPNAQSRCSPEFVLFAQEAGGPPDAVGPRGALGAAGAEGAVKVPDAPRGPGWGRGEGSRRPGRGARPRSPPSLPSEAPLGAHPQPHLRPRAPLGSSFAPRWGWSGRERRPGWGRGKGAAQACSAGGVWRGPEPGTPLAEPLAAQRTGPAAGRARWLRGVSNTLSSDTVTAR